MSGARPWLLRNLETGAAFPNGVGMMGQDAKRFPSMETAYAYAEKYGVQMES